MTYFRSTDIGELEKKGWELDDDELPRECPENCFRSLTYFTTVGYKNVYKLRWNGKLFQVYTWCNDDDGGRWSTEPDEYETIDELP